MDVPVIRIAASHMRPAAEAFRADFVQNHLVPQAAYPVSKALQATQIKPNSPAALRLLLGRGALNIQGDHVTNDIGSVVEADFDPVVNDQFFTVSVEFPKPFEATVTYDASSLVFSITTPIGVAFVTKPALPGASAIIPDSATLVSVAITAAGLAYEFVSDDSGKFVILNDFTADNSAISHKALLKMTANRPRLLDTGICGGSSWYVVKDSGGLCYIRQGANWAGANGYTLGTGPVSQAEATAWAQNQTNCPLGYS